MGTQMEEIPEEEEMDDSSLAHSQKRRKISDARLGEHLRMEEAKLSERASELNLNSLSH